MFSITVVAKPAQFLEPLKGFKGLTITTNKKQTMEPLIGFKGISVALPSIQTGSAIKIVHYR
ncbi:hypothetical protein KHS38_11705 [Mucilaginibacter sp. Bleaf8]|uniref:hypothetical protein n=1 Tax=Mucilaginibacter sp. Bleaf8 TaxID=2834430 RepID=UPI001BCBD6A8|nr:hypothetical protein [Mucilaginibacter sp. Bleaf8]MBS7565070.1 hypothetical protein [Mucilaginibacter sp. Bleaf8]